MPAKPVLTLFAECPACGYPVDDGDLCGRCQPMLDEGFIRRVPAPAPPAPALPAPAAIAELTEQLARADGERAVQAGRDHRAASEWRMNQLCWVCEERRKCHPDPDFPSASDRWICKDCAAIQ